MAAQTEPGKTPLYYVPAQSVWPIYTAVALLIIAIGGANFIQQSTDKVANDGTLGGATFAVGIFALLICMWGWFRETVVESLGGKNSTQLSISYRMGMGWFIFSEVMFFAAFFGALFYTRLLTIPWLGGAGNNAMTHELLWPQFQAFWPLTLTPDGRTFEVMSPWGLPAINTLLLVTSGVFLTIAHHAIKVGDNAKVLKNLAVAIILGFIFMGVQAYEYYHAYHELGLTLNSGIYGSLFFILTGFHGVHVTIGAIMLAVMWVRTAKGHFTPENHFAFEAAAWYWHFVDVVWIFLFFVVYWL
ncbi:MAG: cytochrome c oxidase subunit 3 [Pseudomonadota bacterium]|nr:cytochrome c oxidase subunit 3 [Pseudomonadota bacterium]